jgi:hypothetical protein
MSRRASRFARHAYIVAMMADEAELARTVLLDRILDTTDVERACKELTEMLKGTVVA